MFAYVFVCKYEKIKSAQPLWAMADNDSSCQQFVVVQKYCPYGAYGHGFV